jgi:hypothetical protein
MQMSASCKIFVGGWFPHIAATPDRKHHEPCCRWENLHGMGDAELGINKSGKAADSKQARKGLPKVTEIVDAEVGETRGVAGGLSTVATHMHDGKERR